MRELVLFAGAGGGILGTRLLGWKPVCYVEINPYCIEVLKVRIQEGFIQNAPIWDDIKTFDGSSWQNQVDVITAGFPCQPFSSAGKRRANSDSRNLWPETFRLIRDVRPSFVLLENVPGLRHKSHGYFGQVLQDLASCGFNARWDCVSASAIGAPHQRDRLWIVAYARGYGAKRVDGVPSGGRNLADYKHIVEPGDWNGIQFNRKAKIFRSESKRPPCLCRVDDGLAYRLDRLRSIGNGQVPAVVKFVWEAMTTMIA